VKTYDKVIKSAARTLSGESLRARAARGGALLGSGSFVEQTFRFGRNILLARLLVPDAFGAMAIVLSSSALISSFSDVGTLPAIIQNPRGADRSYLNAAWWMEVARALCMYTAVFIAAPWIARFYGNTALTALLRVALLSTVFDGMLSPRAKLAHKEMKFGRWALISNGGGICGVLLTIALSLIMRNVWALAIGYCSENIFRCAFSYILYPSLPSTSWDKHAFRDIIMFSKGMVGLSFLNLIFARADIFVLGKLYTPAALGIYALAVTLVQTPAGFLIKILSQTVMPALSHVQENKQRMNRIVTEVTSWTILLGLPIVATLSISGSSLLRIVYGARYSEGAGALAFAAGVVFLNTLNSFITSLFFASGRPALHRRAVGISALIMMIGVYPACKHFGLMGGQIAALIAIIAGYIAQSVRVRTITGLNILQCVRVLLPAVLVSIGIVIVCMGTRYLGLATGPSAEIGIACIGCVAAYIICAPIFAGIKQAA
jgi:PST family polysaccharide transporter/lipopolysaccharide exporter